MLAAFGPNPATMFLSWRGGAQASAPPRRDDFREVFYNRLQTRLASRDRVGPGTDLRGKSRPGRLTNLYQAKPAAARSGKAQQAAGVEERNRQEEAHRTRKQDESPGAAAGLAGDNRETAEARQSNRAKANPAGPPPALQDLIAFLQSLPDGSLKIAPDQIPAVADYLLSAGLPRAEVERLLLSPDFAAKGLTAPDLQAAWQRTQSQVAAETGPPAAPDQQPQPGLNLPEEAQEMLLSPGHRARWESARVPEGALPALRLALARLGCSPQDLAQLEEEAQGQGLPLSRVWQLIQESQNRGVQPQAQEPVNQQGRSSPGENQPNPSPAAVLEQRPVSAEEVAQWRQLLVQAGLKPEVVDKMLGQDSLANQGDLKNTLLALAPPDQPSPALSDPKPLYLPENLRLRPFFPQDQANWDQSQMYGQGNGEQPYGSDAEWAAANGETFLLPAFTGELQTFTPNVSGTGALSSTAPLWNQVAPEVRESLWSQLQSGIISNLQPGENQVSLRLNPPEMGQINLNLNLSGQDLAVTAVASRPEIAELAAQGVQQLIQALAQQGLVLTQFQVRLQDQPQVLTTAAQTGSRGKGGETGEKFSASSRQRRGAVDRFA